MKKFIIIPVTINQQSIFIYPIRYGRKLYTAIFLTLLLYNGSYIYAQPKAFIPDTNFRAFLNTNYPAFMDGSGDSLLIDSTATLTGTLDCSSQNIADLTGVEYFINITQLNCSDNQLTFLPDLTNDTALQYLYCNDNQLTTLPALTNNTALQQLRCYSNQLTALPDLTNNIDLQSLSCSNNQLTVLPDLTNNTALEWLYCGGNQLTTLPDLTNNTALQSLSCSNNQLTVLPDLTNNTALEWLLCSGNQLTSLPDLTTNTALQYLYCKNNQLTALPSLSTNTALQLLYCENNQLTALPDLNNINLSILYCHNNQLTALPDLTNNTNLGILHCYNNQLTTLPDLTNNTTLQTLYCYNNQLTALPDLSNNTILSRLYCYNNQLTTLPDLDSNTSLKWLYCQDNQLTALPDLTNNIALWWVYCNNNQLTALPDFTNTVLQLLDCSYNKLDFSDARELRITDTISTLLGFWYSPQNPFGIADTFNLNVGDTLILSIANQDSALSYQWFRGTDTIAGATDTLLIIPNVTLFDNGIYTCRSYGTALDNPPMTLGPGISSFVSEPFTVNIPDPRPKTFIPGTNFRNFLNANYPAFMDVPGDSLLIDSAATLTGTLDCSVKNIADLTGIEYFINITQLNCNNNKLDFSDARELRIADTISTLTSYTYSPQNPFGTADTFNLNTGDTLTLSIVKQDSALSYQWFRGTDTIAGATDTLLTILNAGIADSGVYTCRSYGTVLLFPSPMSFPPGISSFVSEPFTVNISDTRTKAFIPGTNFRNFLIATYPAFMDGSGDSLIVDSAAAFTGTMDCSVQSIADLAGIEHFTNIAQLICNNNKLDFSDAREFRIVDTISTLTVYTYSPQNPFGTADTFDLNGGDTLVLSIAAQDSALSYQWFRGTDTITGATDTLLTVSNVTLSDSGVYTCRSYGTALLSPSVMSFAPGISSFVSEPFTVSVTIDTRAKAFIPDTNFRAFLNTTYPDFMDGSGDSLVIDSAATLTGTLNCSSQNIADLTGVEYFVNITNLYCYNNQLTTLPNLDSLTFLQRLYCYNNQLTTLPDLDSNTALIALYCDNNQLTNLPALTNNTALEELYCYNNQLTALPALTNNTALLWLYCENNQLAVLPDLSNNIILDELYCENNKLDFSDAKELRIADVISSLFFLSYSPQNPFGIADTFNLNVGDTLILSIANQDSALSYQWFRGTDTIAGAADTLLIIPNVTPADSGVYTCRSYGTALDSPPMINGFGISSFVSEPLTVNFLSVSLSASISYQKNVSCNGGQDGEAAVTVTGGTLPYTLQWSDTLAQITDTAYNLYEGIYYVVVTDSLGAADTAYVTITEPLALTGTITGTNSCFGDSNGTATVTPSGGTSPYTYLWADAQTNQLAINLPAGTHTVIVTDSNGCSITDSITLTENPAYNITDSAIAICNGDSISIYGTFRSVAATYYDSSTTNNGCDSIHSTILTVNPLPTVNLGTDTTICNSCSITLDAGGGFVSYNWSTGDTTQTITVDSTATYIVQITNANGCINEDTIVVDILSGINLQSSISNYQLKVHPNPNTGEFTITFSIKIKQHINSVKSDKVSAKQFHRVNLKIYNIESKVIYKEDLNEFKGSYSKEIDMSSYAKGIYNLRLIYDEGTINKKIILE